MMVAAAALETELEAMALVAEALNDMNATLAECAMDVGAKKLEVLKAMPKRG
jgi:ABC-type spermidine/putrescine transport system permease subunit II